MLGISTLSGNHGTNNLRHCVVLGIGLLRASDKHRLLHRLTFIVKVGNIYFFPFQIRQILYTGGNEILRHIAKGKGFSRHIKTEIVNILCQISHLPLRTGNIAVGTDFGFDAGKQVHGSKIAAVIL